MDVEWWASIQEMPEKLLSRDAEEDQQAGTEDILASGNPLQEEGEDIFARFTWVMAGRAQRLTPQLQTPQALAKTQRKGGRVGGGVEGL